MVTHSPIMHFSLVAKGWAQRALKYPLTLVSKGMWRRLSQGRDMVLLTYCMMQTKDVSPFVASSRMSTCS